MFFRPKRRRTEPGRKAGIILKNAQEIARLRAANQLVAEIFAMLGQAIRPGVSLHELDQLAAAYIKRYGAKPLYLGYRGNPPTHPPFPGVICASVNNEICHGLPNERILQAGDIVGIDIGLQLDGFCGDACVTYPVGEISPAVQRLLQVAEACLYVGIAEAQTNRHLSNIGAAIQTYAERHGYSVVEEWGGHGIGRNLHEAPSVPHTGPARRGPRLRSGMVFTIEPMINAGGPACDLQADGWTVTTRDGSLSAQFEHTIAITLQGPEILSKLPGS